MANDPTPAADAREALTKLGVLSAQARDYADGWRGRSDLVVSPTMMCMMLYQLADAADVTLSADWPALLNQAYEAGQNDAAGWTPPQPEAGGALARKLRAAADDICGNAREDRELQDGGLADLLTEAATALAAQPDTAQAKGE